MTVSAVAREGFWDGAHVSRTLNCTYLRPAPEGTVLLVESSIVHLGKTMGQMTGVMKRKDDGKVCYTVGHITSVLQDLLLTSRQCEHGKAQVEFMTKPKL